jgi:hypothetical protein
MPAKQNTRVVDSLALLESIERGLAARPGVDPKVKAILTANAEQAARFARRLSKPKPGDWKDFLAAVAKRPTRDAVRRFLLGEESHSFDLKSPRFLNLILRIGVEFVQHGEGSC